MEFSNSGPSRVVHETRPKISLKVISSMVQLIRTLFQSLHNSQSESDFLLRPRSTGMKRI